MITLEKISTEYIADADGDRRHEVTELCSRVIP